MILDRPGGELVGWLLLALVAGRLAGSRARRIAGAGLLSLGLALAAWRVSEPARMASPDTSADGFLAVNGGLLVAGLGLIVWAAVRQGTSIRRVAAVGLSLAGAALVASADGSALRAGDRLRIAVCAALIGLVSVGLVALGRAVAHTPASRAIARLFPRPVVAALPSGERSTPLVLAFAAAVAATALGPHVAVICLGAAGAAWAGWLLLPEPRPWPVAPALTLLLVPTYWLLATIAGPVGLWTADLAMVPLSPAAESVVVAALLATAWAMTALWPLSGQLPGTVTGAVAAALLTRVALPLAPDGIAQWRPLLVPIVIAGLWHAAVHARWALIAAGGALLGLVSPDPRGAIGGAVLVACAIAMEIGRYGSALSVPARAGRLLVWVASAWGGLLVIEGSLRGEVVYTAVATAGLALIVAGGRVDSGHERVHIRPDETS
jgi:hypothetical protein